MLVTFQTFHLHLYTNTERSASGNILCLPEGNLTIFYFDNKVPAQQQKYFAITFGTVTRILFTFQTVLL